MTKNECERFLGNAALVVGRLPDDVEIHIGIITSNGPTIQISSNDDSEIHFDFEYHDPETKQTVYETRTQGTTLTKYIPEESKEDES